MPGNITNSEEERLLKNSLGISPSSNVFLGIFQSSKSEAQLESGNATSEITGYSGDRKQLSWTELGQVDGAWTVENASVIEFVNMPALTVGYVAIFTAATGGTMRWWGPLGTNRPVEAGDTLRFQSGEIDVSLD